jgi:hypothetical protein
VLNGPRRARFAMRKSRALSSRVTAAFRLDDGEGAVEGARRENTAGTADRWERILLEVSWACENRGRDLRTANESDYFVKKMPLLLS